MLNETSIHRHSSVVTLQLLVGDDVYPLAQVGPDFVILKQPTSLPSGRATIVMCVDGEERRWDVDLQETSAPTELVPTRAA